MTEKPLETQAESHVVELKEKVNNSFLMKHRKVLRLLRKRYCITVLVATTLPAGFAGIFEFVMSRGTSGLVPLWAGLLSGVLTAVVLLLIQPQEETKIERALVQRSVHELVQQISGLTSVAAKPVIARYVGSWIGAGGPVFDVGEHGDTITVYVSGVDGPGFILHFERKTWSDKLRLFDKGDVISAVGQISSISELGVILNNCELE